MVEPASPKVAAGVLILAVVLGVGPFLLPSISQVPYYWVVVAGVVAFTSYVFLGDLLVAVLLWFFTVACLHEEFWRIIVPFFFNLTVPRILLMVLGAMFVAMWAVGRFRLTWPGAAGWLILTILAYFSASAIVGGFETVAVATVHYRLFGGYWFAFVIFFIVLHSVRQEKDVKRVLVFFFAFTLYLTVTGWCEHFEFWSLVFPRFVGDPTRGIHWGRVRGPFLVSAAMGLALVFGFFSNLLLARTWTGVRRMMLYGVNAAMLPAIFWTYTRSVWLAMITCGIIWVAYSTRRANRIIGVSLLSAAVLVVGAVNWENMLTERREVGGVGQVDPIIERLGLALITLDMVKDRPLTGVGFGHFRDAAPRYVRDPASRYYRFAAQSMEHNNLLSILAECGLIGLLLWVLLLVVLLRASIRVYSMLPAGAPGLLSRDLIVLYWILFANWFIDGSFRETSVNPFANSLFFALSGLVLAVEGILGPQPLPQPPARLMQPIALPPRGTRAPA